MTVPPLDARELYRFFHAGGEETETLRAFTREEAEGIIRKL